MAPLFLAFWTALSPTPADGRAVAVEKCAACHALDGVHASPNPGAPGFAEIGRRISAADLPARLTVVTRSGHYAMPRRSLSAAERRALAAYIREAADRAERDAGN